MHGNIYRTLILLLFGVINSNLKPNFVTGSVTTQCVWTDKKTTLTFNTGKIGYKHAVLQVNLNWIYQSNPTGDHPGASIRVSYNANTGVVTATIDNPTYVYGIQTSTLIYALWND